VACQQGAAGCVGDGWVWAVPDCGDGGMLAHCVPYLALGCGPWSVWSVQRCR
jgi:hypothetical protein